MNRIFLSFKNLYGIVDKKFRKKFYLLSTLMFISAIFEIISLGSIIPFVSSLLDQNFFSENFIGIKIRNFLPEYENKYLIMIILIGFSLIVIISGIFKTFLLWLTTNFNAEVGIDLSNKVYEKILFVSYKDFITQKSNRIISDVANKVTTVIFFVMFPLLLLLTSIIQIFAIIIFLMSINTLLIIIIFFFLVIFYSSTFTIVKKKLFKNSKLIANQEISLVRQIQESFGGKKEIMINNLQKFFFFNFKISNHDLRKSQASNAFLNILPKYIIETFAIVLISIIIFHLVNNETLSSTRTDTLSIIALLGFSAQKLMPLIQQVYASLARIVGSYDSLLSIDKILKINAKKNKQIDKRLEFSDSIKLKNIAFSYGKKNLVKNLKNINLTIKKGEKIGIVGKTGSGKSTLVDLISGLLEPTSGHLIIDREIVNKKNIDLWQKNIAIVPQKIFLSDDSILKNIAYSVFKKDIDLSLIDKAAKNADLKDLINVRKNKIHTKVGEGGVTLSGGQRQKIAIARAFYKKANLIIFDEATSALDLKTEQKILKILKKLSSNITLIIISHRVDSLKFCDKIIELQEGQIKNFKNFNELIKKSVFFKNLISQNDKK